MRSCSDEVLREGILRDYQTMSFKNIGLKYTAGEKRVREMAKTLGVKKDLRLIWNDESEQYLKDTFSDTNSEEIAKVLGFTVSSICAKAQFFKIYESGRYEGEYLVHLKLFEMARAGDIKAIDKLSVIRKQFDKEK